MNKYFLVSALAITLTFSSCSDDSYKIVESNSPTSGKLSVYCDAGLQVQMKNQAFTFEKIYEKAKINIVPCSEAEAIKALFSDSCKAITLNRKLTSKEEEQFKASNIVLNSIMVGKSAVALITNIESTDTVINIETLKSIIAGDTAKQYYRNVVFESKKSSALSYFTDSLLQGKKLGTNCSATNDLKELLEKISTNKNTIGVLDYVWISDRDDSLFKSIENKFMILPISATGSNTAFYPDQSNIQTSAYPLTRWIYIFRRGEDFSLAAGFFTYIAGPSGQMILLKSGLAPWRQPERLIEVNMKPIDAE